MELVACWSLFVKLAACWFVFRETYILSFSTSNSFFFMEPVACWFYSWKSLLADRFCLWNLLHVAYPLHETCSYIFSSWNSFCSWNSLRAEIYSWSLLHADCCSWGFWRADFSSQSSKHFNFPFLNLYIIFFQVKLILFEEVVACWFLFDEPYWFVLEKLVACWFFLHETCALIFFLLVKLNLLMQLVIWNSLHVYFSLSETYTFDFLLVKLALFLELLRAEFCS